MSRRSLEEVALEIFGGEENPAYARWLQYWRDSRKRNTSLLQDFERIVLLDLREKRVLDVGCGTGGLAEILTPRCKAYCGVDYHSHVLQFSDPDERTSFVQSDASMLPFPDNSFDFIFAFDIIEHLAGGPSHQREFLREVNRVLTPLGMFFLTTPNFWYPYDAHSGLYIPQLLPRFLRDRYIRRASPGFIEEHKTFDAIHLLKPGFLRSALADSALSAIHELPCCLDRDEYFRLHPVRGALAYLGLGWYFHAEFWIIVGHQEIRQKLRSKLKKNWFYQLNQPDDNPMEDFASSIDFDQGMFNHQLRSGWHWYERDKRGFRWTEEKATCYLQSRSSVQYIEISGYSPVENTIQIYVDGVRVGVHRTHSESGFDLKYLLPFPLTNDQIFEITIESDRAIQPQDSLDKRELSLMVFSLGVTE